MYLAWILFSENSDWPAAFGNLWKERQKWGRFYRMLVWEGGVPWKYGRLYVAVV